MASLSLCGCPNAQERDAGLPLMTALTYEGAARDNARVLLFRVDFRDEDGDLSAGNLAVLINGKTALADPLSMKDLFIKSGLPLNAQNGTLLFEVQMDIRDDAPPESGSVFSVGVLATDGAGQESNRPTVTLEISY
jgi:hypothetical protein